MRLDPTVLAYFRALAEKSGVPYQSLINFVLREYANRALEPSANWGQAQPPVGWRRQRDHGTAN